jgi:hypothetical protein
MVDEHHYHTGYTAERCMHGHLASDVDDMEGKE